MSALADKSPLERGIAALQSFLGEDAAFALLQPTPIRSSEAASFLFPLPIDYMGQQRHLRIGFPSNFPKGALQLHVEPSPWLVWPHAMESGLCLHGFRERPVTGSPESIVRDGLSRLAQIVTLSQMGADEAKRAAEFQNEITSYWSIQHGRSAQKIILLDRPANATSLFAVSDPRHTVQSGLETVWLATNVSVIKKHFRRVVGKQVNIRAPDVPGFYVKLHTFPDIRVPEPREILHWITPHLHNDDAAKLSFWFAEGSAGSNRWIVLELPGKESAPTYCLNIRSKGLRPDRAPIFGLRSARRWQKKSPAYFPAVVRSSRLEVLDRATILSRDLSGNTKGLETKRVVLVGVGSLGGAVAFQLARSGVGHLTLIDPDTLTSANLGRHVLGADDLGKPKVVALRDRIIKDLPTVDVTAIDTYAEFVIYLKPDLLEKADLVIITTADWESEVAFWNEKSDGAPWGMLQAWSEPHTHVGHVLYAPKGACDARHLFSDSGNFNHKYTEWPEGGVVPLPACGESFIPGGSLGMTNVASMVSHAALRALTSNLHESVWLTCVYRPQDIAPLGGEYKGPELPDGVQQTVFDRKWPGEGKRVS